MNKELPLLPGGWEWDGEAKRELGSACLRVSEVAGDLRVASVVRDVEASAKTLTDIPLSVVAAVLRRAGWRVEEPETSEESR